MAGGWGGAEGRGSGEEQGLGVGTEGANWWQQLGINGEVTMTQRWAPAGGLEEEARVDGVVLI